MTNRDDAHMAARDLARRAGVSEWPRIRRRRGPTGLCGLLVLIAAVASATGIAVALGDGEAAGAGALVAALLIGLACGAVWDRRR